MLENVGDDRVRNEVLQSVKEEKHPKEKEVRLTWSHIT